MSMPRLVEDDFFDLRASRSRNQQAVRFSNKNYLQALKSPQTPQAVVKIINNPSRGNKVVYFK